MVAFRFCVMLLLAAAIGCGGSSTPADDPATPQPDETTPAELDPQAKAESELRERQNAGCFEMCSQLTECAYQSAVDNLSAEEAEKLKVAKPKNTEQCTEGCSASQLSPRQVKVIEVCVGHKLSCDEIHECLDHAKSGS